MTLSFLRVGFCFFVFNTYLSAGEFLIQASTDKQVAIYAPGEEMKFRFKVLEDGKAVDGKRLVWTRSGDDGKTESGEAVAGVEGVVVTTQLDQPGFVRMKVVAFDEDGSRLKGFIGGWGPSKQGEIFFEGGACVEPEKLEASEEPGDFDDFWAGMKAQLAAVPLTAERTEVESSDPKVKLYAVSVACAGAKPVTGYLSIPTDAAPGSLPAICQYQGYGVPKHVPPGWLNPTAIVFNVNAHGMELGREDAYYAQLKKDLGGYAFDAEENSDPQSAYFHDMALRVLRSLEYVKSLPEWNGKELHSHGGSQGGLQGLWGAGVDPDVTDGNFWSPWCCDLAGVQKGRIKGWRPDYTEALAYYDPVFHARRIKGKVHLVANYGDYTCPPSGVWTVYNQIPHTQKSMEVKQGCTHGYTMIPYMSYTYTPTGVKEVGFKEK